MTCAAVARTLLISALLGVPLVAAQPAAPAPTPGGIGNSDSDTRSYDKRDFSGLWARSPELYGEAPCPECREPVGWPGYGFFGDIPARTEEGQRRMDLNKPARGLELGSAEANARTDLDSGLRRAILPAFGNDPEMRCEPLGLARLITFAGPGAAMELIQQQDRILQTFEWTWDFREIWMDGRRSPNVEDYLPRFNGYSVARWEGDTLVVTSVGFDDRQWIDQHGYPLSSEAVLEERWDRPSPNRLRVQLTLTDPLLYTRPWQASTKVWSLIPKESMAIAGWSGILEDRCVPSDESMFNQVRDRAAGLGEE